MRVFRWFDFPMCIFFGMIVGGYIYGAVPCLIYGGGIVPCAMWGIVGVAAAFYDLPAWIALPDMLMIYLVTGSSAAYFIAIMAFRYVRASSHQTKAESKTNQ
jgi:hypothetical protein